MAFGSTTLGRMLSRRHIKKTTGVLSNKDADRMARRAEPEFFGISESSFPESAPDPEEIARAARRRALSRRRGGRMSTILTAGLGSASEPLGGG